jgi:hypothetical protein
VNTNSSRHGGFWRRAHGSVVTVELARLHRDLATIARQLAPTAAASPETVRLCPPRALVRSGCTALDRVVELPVLARQATQQVDRRTDADVVAQADRLAAVAAELAVVLRASGIGFSGEAGRVDGLAGDLGVGLDGAACLGPNETHEGLILVAETLSLAARLVLVLVRLHASRGRVRRSMHAFSKRMASLAVGWTVRVASLSLPTDLVHPRPAASIAAWAAAALVALVALRAQFGRSRPVLVVADMVGVIASAALPHPVLVASALAEFVAVTGSLGRRAITSRPREASGGHRERRRDQ